MRDEGQRLEGHPQPVALLSSNGRALLVSLSLSLRGGTRPVRLLPGAFRIQRNSPGGLAGRVRYDAAEMPWIPGDFTHHIPTPTWQVRPRVEQVVREAGPEAVALDLGAGGRRLAPNVVCVDFVPFPGTEVVGDVQRLPFADASVDLIVATGLIEHVDDDRALLNEAFRVLKPGGIAHFELPFLQFYHDDPVDYRRYTVPGLEREMVRAGFQTIESNFNIGPTVGLLYSFIYYGATLFEGRNVVSRVLSNLVFVFLSFALSWLRYVDWFLKDKKSAHRLAFGVFCTSRKPAST